MNTSTAYLRYSIDNALVDNPQDAIGTRNVIPAIPQNLVLAWQKIFSPTLINEAKFGLNRSDYHNWTYGTSPITASFAGFDGVSDSGQEIYNFCRQEGIDKIVLMGVHTNICILNRGFGARQMTRLGFDVVLARDLTDSMYDPRTRPFVSHARGTELVIEHIDGLSPLQHR